jgi:hypothetical protein
MKKHVLYIVDLKTSSSSLQAGVYLLKEDGTMKPLWPDMHSEFNGKLKQNHDKAAKALGMSIQNRDGNAPKYFFKFTGYGYNKWDECGRAAVRAMKLCGFEGEFKVYSLRGFSPTLEFQEDAPQG